MTSHTLNVTSSPRYRRPLAHVPPDPPDVVGDARVPAGDSPPAPLPERRHAVQVPVRPLEVAPPRRGPLALERSAAVAL